MMNSSYDDEFAPNPFRSANQQQQQQQQQDWFQPQISMSGNNMNQPDPYSGMVGALDMPDSPPRVVSPVPGLQPSYPPHDPTQWTGPMDQRAAPRTDPTQWSGAMDQRAAPVENYGGPMISQPPGAPAGGFPQFGWRTCVSCFQMESYTQYFDLETTDVLDRLKASLFKFWLPDQFRTSVVGDVPTEVLKGPDLYGPVWISFTLVFLIAVTSNIQAYWAHKRKQKHEEGLEEFEVDINRLLHASSVVLFFVFCVSTAFWLGTSCMGMPGISWAMWVCCYGYSQVPYMAAAVLIAVLPFELISWCSLAAATVASALLVLRNLSTPLMAQDSASQAKSAPFILAILCAHTIYFLFLKVMFYP